LTLINKSDDSEPCLDEIDLVTLQAVPGQIRTAL